MVSRLETMVLMGMELPVSAIRRQIASGVDIFIHLGRLRDRTRKVLEITEIEKYDPATGEVCLNTLYRFCETGSGKGGKVEGILQKESNLIHVQKMIRAGLTP